MAAVTDDPFFAVFAEWARDKGLEDACRRLAGRLSDPDLESFVSEYRRLINEAQRGQPTGILNGRETWYPGPLDGDLFWPALDTYFDQNLKWSDSSLKLLDHSSSKVLACTPDPRRLTYTAKGLVVGYVQSGKTTNFTSVIAKAADCGYRLVIVLSGIHNGLRRQTQERLDGQLRDLNDTRWLNLTLPERDFSTPSMRSTSLLDKDKVSLAVVKKNKAVLKKLKNWLSDAVSRNALADLPVLIIDDEADQATVATKTINPLIRAILEMIPRCTYIGYTATPFANVLIDPAADDLYPKDFILNLPKPEGYFGTERIFGRDEVEGDGLSGADLDGYDMVRTIPDDELDALRPISRSAAPTFSPHLTDTLINATRWFWLATAARRVRGDEGHSTMLIHTSMQTAVHDSYRDPLIHLRDSTLQGVLNGEIGIIDQMRVLWDREVARVPAHDFELVTVAFEHVVEKLAAVIRATKIVLDNYRSEDRLDYSDPGQIAIAVGGNTLSRGLTLEGLVVSFFVRSAKAYDTLLQMARWFGFRQGYEDLPRVWMTPQLTEWFRHLATVEHEIRLDIERYERENLTPIDFGVRIRTHPILRVTAKMGAAQQAYTSYGGRRVQTRYFPEHDLDWLTDNVKAADRLVQSARSAIVEESPALGVSLYRGVEWETVQSFLTSFHVHADSPDLDSALIGKYVERQREQQHLDLWNVAVVGSDRSDDNPLILGGREFSRIKRSKLRGTGPDRADIKTLMSKEHRVADLSIDPSTARAMSETDLVAAREADQEAKQRGLLLLYPIARDSAPDSANQKNRMKLDAFADVVGLALVFPGNAGRTSEVESTYVQVDLREVEQIDDEELAALEGVSDE